MKSFLRFASTVLILSKVKITIAVAFTTITGYVLGKGAFDAGFVWVTLGIFLLACGSSVLNHVQEFRTDSVMERTQNRPLPQKQISTKQALLIAIVEIFAGSVILYIGSNLTALLLGLLALVWYNFIYTPLKKVTPHAVIPGSVIGSIPPMVGWVAAGASLADTRVWVMAVFFFVWQVPHFYLLVLKYGKQYQAAGFPALTNSMQEKSIRFLIFIWVLTTAIAALSLFYFRVVVAFQSMVLLTVSSIWLIVVFLIPLLKPEREFKPFRYFMRINYYVLFVILVLNFDHFIR
jgi:protoheme IX farnesyltransferase